ncbi:hypothetical protein [Aliivibrio kagoshimensis]|uniref:hypothetical protein n=1 Tax=Aliivibrio kagoshimensis TaxID=2910230 RepID=UPI003D0FE630
MKKIISLLFLLFCTGVQAEQNYQYRLKADLVDFMANEGTAYLHVYVNIVDIDACHINLSVEVDVSPDKSNRRTVDSSHKRVDGLFVMAHYNEEFQPAFHERRLRISNSSNGVVNQEIHLFEAFTMYDYSYSHDDNYKKLKSDLKDKVKTCKAVHEGRAREKKLNDAIQSANDSAERADKAIASALAKAAELKAKQTELEAISNAINIDPNGWLAYSDRGYIHQTKNFAIILNHHLNKKAVLLMDPVIHIHGEPNLLSKLPSSVRKQFIRSNYSPAKLLNTQTDYLHIMDWYKRQIVHFEHPSFISAYLKNNYLGRTTFPFVGKQSLFLLEDLMWVVSDHYGMFSHDFLYIDIAGKEKISAKQVRHTALKDFVFSDQFTDEILRHYLFELFPSEAEQIKQGQRSTNDLLLSMIDNEPMFLDLNNPITSDNTLVIVLPMSNNNALRVLKDLDKYQQLHKERGMNIFFILTDKQQSLSNPASPINRIFCSKNIKQAMSSWANGNEIDTKQCRSSMERNKFNQERLKSYGFLSEDVTFFFKGQHLDGYKSPTSLFNLSRPKIR